MINVSSLVDAIVDHLRKIPDLVAILQGRENAIYAYHDRFADTNSVALAIAKMEPGQLMVVWVGSVPGAPTSWWKHQIKIYIRANEEDFNGATPEGYYEIVRLIFDGVPEGQSLPMRAIEPLESVDPMQDESISRSSDLEGVDYFEIDLAFNER